MDGVGQLALDSYESVMALYANKHACLNVQYAV